MKQIGNYGSRNAQYKFRFFSADPADDFLLAMSEAGQADYLVTGDKSGLLALDRHKATRIVSASDFAALFLKKGSK